MKKEKVLYTLVVGEKVEEGETEIIIETREELKKRKEKGE